MTKLFNPDFRKYRTTKIVNTGTLKTIETRSLLDSGSKVTVLGLRQAIELNLAKEGNFDLVHSNNYIETTFFSSIFIRIRGEDFLIKVVVTEIFSGLIIGADFMRLYSMRLFFDKQNNDIKLREIKTNKLFNWDIR